MLILSSGRRVHLVSLHQENIYAGLLEGVPTREMNQGTIEHLRDEATERTGREPFILQPVQTPIERGGGADPYPFGDPALIPPIACVAELESSGSSVLYHTHLTVIWFQDDYAFPLAAPIESALLALDWDRLAVEEER